MTEPLPHHVKLAEMEFVIGDEVEVPDELLEK